MINIPDTKCLGLDMKATGARIGKMIDESGLNDKQLGEIMHLSVQSINKWRHGHNLPDSENMFILSRILGIRVDDFFVPKAVRPAEIQIEIEPVPDPASMLNRVKEYANRLMAVINHTLSAS